jgi:hypothetical protein
MWFGKHDDWITFLSAKKHYYDVLYYYNKNKNKKRLKQVKYGGAGGIAG